MAGFEGGLEQHVHETAAAKGEVLSRVLALEEDPNVSKETVVRLEGNVKALLGQQERDKRDDSCLTRVSAEVSQARTQPQIFSVFTPERSFLSKRFERIWHT